MSDFGKIELGQFDANRCVVIKSPMGGTDPNLDRYLRADPTIPFIAVDVQKFADVRSAVFLRALQHAQDAKSGPLREVMQGEEIAFRMLTSALREGTAGFEVLPLSRFPEDRNRRPYPRLQIATKPIPVTVDRPNPLLLAHQMGKRDEQGVRKELRDILVQRETDGNPMEQRTALAILVGAYRCVDRDGLKGWLGNPDVQRNLRAIGYKENDVYKPGKHQHGLAIDEVYRLLQIFIGGKWESNTKRKAYDQSLQVLQDAGLYRLSGDRRFGFRPSKELMHARAVFASYPEQLALADNVQVQFDLSSADTHFSHGSDTLFSTRPVRLDIAYTK